MGTCAIIELSARASQLSFALCFPTHLIVMSDCRLLPVRFNSFWLTDYLYSSEHGGRSLNGAAQDKNDAPSHHCVPKDTYVYFIHTRLLLVETSPPEPRRAAVAIIIRIVPVHGFASSSNWPQPQTLPDFFALDWVNEPGVRPEILFLRREAPLTEKSVAQNTPRNAEDAHVAFPGGRTEEGDEGGLYTGKFREFHLKSES